jgi:hypothetical protein
MNQPYGTRAFHHTENFFKDANAQAIAEKSIAASKDFYDKAAAVAQETRTALTEITDTAWGSAKMLNDRIVRNMTANVDSAFTAAREIAAAKSLPDIAKIQAEYMQKAAAQAAAQTKEFVDLSTRAMQHTFEKMQAAATNVTKPVA